ncbi:hypothetical protein [Mucilaginibacter arboris]|uniref:Uncharacterized protein n=1 Tax=Mucilaginibacter arboris TaxID=2682090 RepID=A0A7K1SSB0_9SPHI|nr:hypothetical protein [Mucilaginibacter arboris]MVN20206.1 hypothetical protein [Mucilaginibacter arboris]
MDGHLQNIFNESKRIISKLQLLAAFFGEEILYKIYLRSQVIHQMFEQNPELDANNLELFHLQYTASLIELLKKIKKNNEKNVSLLFDEMQLNKELEEKLSNSFYTEKSYKLDQQKQALKINISLRRLYQLLSDNVDEYPFSKNINSFSSKFSQDFYDDVPPELLNELTHYNPSDVYTNAYAVIQKKLLGLLCKYDFKTEFFCGLKAGNSIVEVYKFVNEDRYFLFYPAKNLFLFCDFAKIENISHANNVSNKEKMIQELKDKNDQLQSSINVTKTYLPQEIKTLLAENYRKLTDISFLQNIGNYDAQANILKTMLNTDMI